ncbi:alpha/beta hydrolase [Streptomyces sp. NPDC060205]|uniref:alpha/beta hydrolase n=1 Tax=Streptomyces sp. NPDC060205 TaxID=3347072 RepID=UPI00365147CC
MSLFVLVSGPFTDGRIWSEVVARLRESGARAHPVSLSRQPGADLETHVEDVVRLIDSLELPDSPDSADPPGLPEEVVLVGHDYAIHPVLGAADRRPERVARVVHLDAGMPQDGDAALALVPDPSVHERLAADGDPGPVPSPEPAQWQRWGSTEGLSPHHLELLSRVAAPQPWRTLTQPLRLTGAAAAWPTTGILCTAGGTTVELVEALVRTGPPHLRKLADPRVGFFELATGHWPMLSCPDELAGVLLRAAADEGRRLTVPEEESSYARPFLLDTPEYPRVREGRVDLHLPDRAAGEGEARGPWPAVLFVHGGPVPAGLVPAPRDSPFYLGYARCAASLGAVGAVVEHRLHGITDYARAADDVAEAVDLLRADPRVDGQRIALWIFSGAGLLAADWIAAPPPWLRCLAFTYPILAPLPGWGAVGPRFDPVGALRAAAGTMPPVVLTRAGLETPQIAATVREFTTAADETKAPVEIIDVPHGRHGFETDEPTDASREAVLRAVRTVFARLARPS